MNVPSAFQPLDVSWNRNAENALALMAAAGYTVIEFGPNFPAGGSTPTGLANDATAYTATVRIDGTNRAVSIVGSAAQTMTTLVAELLVDLTTWATVVQDGDSIVITSKTTGATSGVFVSDTGTNFLFNSVRGTSAGGHYGVVNYTSTKGWTGPDTLSTIAGSANQVGTSVKGNTLYSRWDKLGAIDGLQESVSAVVSTFLAAGTANTNVSWNNAASSLAVPTGTPAQSTPTGLNRLTVYQLRVNVNGAGNVTTSIDLNIPQTTGASFSNLVAALNTGMAAAGLPVVASWQDGYNATEPPRILFTVQPSNTPFTSTSTGAILQGTTSTVVLTAGLANDIVAALVAFGGALDTAQAGFGVVNFNRVNATPVVPATVPAVTAGNYDATVNVNDAGVRTTYTVTVAVTPAHTMTVIAASLQTALQAATGETELVEAVDNKFLFSENQTGFGTSIIVTIPTAGANPDLFNAIKAALDVTVGSITTVQTWSVDGFSNTGVNGTTDLSFPKTVSSVAYANWQQVLGNSPVGGRLVAQNIFGPTGYGPLFTSDSASAFEKENRPQSKGLCVSGILYWDSAAWLYFADDTSAGTNNPPNALANGS